MAASGSGDNPNMQAAEIPVPDGTPQQTNVGPAQEATPTLPPNDTNAPQGPADATAAPGTTDPAAPPNPMPRRERVGASPGPDARIAMEAAPRRPAVGPPPARTTGGKRTLSTPPRVDASVTRGPRLDPGAFPQRLSPPPAASPSRSPLRVSMASPETPHKPPGSSMSQDENIVKERELRVLRSEQYGEKRRAAEVKERAMPIDRPIGT